MNCAKGSSRVQCRGYAEKEGDARQFHPKLRPPVNPEELEIDPRTGMKVWNSKATEGPRCFANAVCRTTWHRRTEAGILRPPTSGGRSRLASTTVAGQGEERALISGKHIAFLVPACTPWKIFWLTATGVNLRCVRWAMNKSSVT